jgi:purine-binding chemotaxis protein CheW
MSRAESIETDEGRVTLGCFEVKGECYAIDVAQIREVVRWQPVTPLPSAPKLIEGVIDLRDALVPVVDLGRALVGEPVQSGDAARIAIVEVDGLALGLIVDAALEVLDVAAGALEDPPELANRSGYAAGHAVLLRRDAPPLLVLSLDHVLDRVVRSASPRAEATA